MGCLFLLFAFFVVIRGSFNHAEDSITANKQGLRMMNKQDPIPWHVSRAQDKSNGLIIRRGESKQITLSPSTPLFVRKYDSAPHEWKEYSWEWKKKHILSPSRSLFLTQKDETDPIWLKPAQLSLALKKGTITFNGIEKLLAVTGCRGVPQNAAQPTYDPKTSLYFRGARTLLKVQGYKAPTENARRREDIKYFAKWSPIGIRCSSDPSGSDPNLWAKYWWIKPTNKERANGYCGSFVLDNYESHSSQTDPRKIRESSPSALLHLTCQQLVFLAANKQFRYPYYLGGHLYVGKEAAAKYAYDDYDDEYEDEYDDEDEFENGYHEYIDSLHDLYQWIEDRLK